MSDTLAWGWGVIFLIKPFFLFIHCATIVPKTATGNDIFFLEHVGIENYKHLLNEVNFKNTFNFHL